MTAIATPTAPRTSLRAHSRATPRWPALPGGTAWLATGALASKASQTLVLLLLAAVLDPAALGVVSLGSVVLNVTTVLADLGTSTALVHFRGDAERAARSAVTLTLGMSLALVALVWAGAAPLADLLGAGATGAEVFRWVVLCVPLAAVAGVSAELLRRSLDFRRRVLPDIVSNAAGAVVTAGALAAGSGVLALVWGLLAQAAIGLVMLWWLRPPVRPGWRADDAGQLLSYGTGLAGGALLSLLMLNVDYVLVAQRLGVEQLGAYSMAFRIAYMPYLLIAVVVAGAAFPRLCRLRGRAAGRAAAQTALATARLLVPAYVALVVFAPQLGRLGEEWAVAVPALRWLAAYGLVLSALEPLLITLKAIGRTADTLGLAALHVGLLLLLLNRYVDRGLTAVAVAQLAAGLLTLLAAAIVVALRIVGVDGAALPRPALARRAMVAGCVVAVALGCGVAAVLWPEPVLVALCAAALAGVTVLRVEWALMGFVAAAPFGHLLQEIDPAALKVVGAVVFLSWAVRVVHDPRPVALRHPGILAVGALVVAVLASFVVNGANVAAARDHTLSYLAYALSVLVLVDSLRRGRPTPRVFARRLATAYFLACTAAGGVAIAGFLAHGGRASGPLADPNDLAFFMITALPFGLVGGHRRRAVAWGFTACATVLVLATLATLSRGALVGLVAIALVAALLGAVRLTTVGAVAGLVLLAGAATWTTHHSMLTESVAAKSQVAASNVEQRLTTAATAADMTAASPLLGRGPGSFAAQRAEFAPAGAADIRETVAHQMYLETSAELGLAGLGTFLGVLFLAGRGAFRARRIHGDRQDAAAVLMALAGAAAAACFLSEQFFLPIWLLAAFGLALDPGRAGGQR